MSVSAPRFVEHLRTQHALTTRIMHNLAMEGAQYGVLYRWRGDVTMARAVYAYAAALEYKAAQLSKGRRTVRILYDSAICLYSEARMTDMANKVVIERDRRLKEEVR